LRRIKLLKVLIVILRIKRINNYKLMLKMKRRLFLFSLCRKFTLSESVNLLIININNEIIYIYSFITLNDTAR